MTKGLLEYLKFLAAAHPTDHHEHFLGLSEYTVHDTYRQMDIYHLSTGERVIVCDADYIADEWLAVADELDIVIHRDKQNQTMDVLR
tara:strand:+ start:6538 stop:6798 length:261 start_codon:yes stop_codon:yes gene_type:complete